MGFTLGNAKQYLADRNMEDSSSRAVRVYVKIANEANKRLRQLGKWDFDKRWSDLSFAGAYSTGTVAVSAAGSTVTGTGTTFTSAMTGRYIRFNGETLQYKFTYVSGTSGTISPAYAGESNLSGVSYQITDDRQALPTGFRDFAWPLTDNRATPRLFPKPLEEIRMYRRLFMLTQYPWYYAVELEEVASIPTPYMHIYPSLSEKRVITIPYFAWPAELTDDAHLFKVPVEAEPVLQILMRALLDMENQAAGWADKLAEAEKEAVRAMGAFRYVGESTQRQIWTPEGDGPAFNIFANTFPGFASGEPRFTGT